VNESLAGHEFLRIDSGFLFFINEILRKITPENKSFKELLNKL